MRDENKKEAQSIDDISLKLDKLINLFELSLKIQFCSAFLVDRPAWLRQFPNGFVDFHNELRLELVREFLDLFQKELKD